RPTRQKTGGQRLTDIPVFPGVRPAPALVAGARVGRTPSRRSRGARDTRETGPLPGAPPSMHTGGHRPTAIPALPRVSPAPAAVAGGGVGGTSTRRSRGSRVTRETGLLFLPVGGWCRDTGRISTMAEPTLDPAGSGAAGRTSPGVLPRRMLGVEVWCVLALSLGA